MTFYEKKVGVQARCKVELDGEARGVSSGEGGGNEREGERWEGGGVPAGEGRGLGVYNSLFVQETRVMGFDFDRLFVVLVIPQRVLLIVLEGSLKQMM